MTWSNTNLTFNELKPQILIWIHDQKTFTHKYNTQICNHIHISGTTKHITKFGKDNRIFSLYRLKVLDHTHTKHGPLMASIRVGEIVMMIFSRHRPGSSLHGVYKLKKQIHFQPPHYIDQTNVWPDQFSTTL